MQTTVEIYYYMHMTLLSEVSPSETVNLDHVQHWLASTKVDLNGIL